MAEPVLVGSPFEQVGSLSVPIGELEEGEIPQECFPKIPISRKSRNNFGRRQRKRALKKAARLLRPDDRIASLSGELASEVAVSSGLQSVLSQNHLRISELEAELRSAEWDLLSTERKLYDETKSRRTC